MRIVVALAILLLSPAAGADLATIAKDVTNVSRRPKGKAKKAGFDRAKAKLEALRKAQPRNGSVEFQLGRIAFYRGKDAEALGHFDRAIKLAAKVGDHHFMRGIVLQYMKRSADSIKSLKRAVALDASRIKFREELCLALDRADKSKEAMACYLEVVKRGTKNATVFLNLSSLAGKAKDHKATLAWAKRAIKADPKNINAYVNAGIASWRLGKVGEAIRLYRAGSKKAPKDLFLLAKLVQMYELAGKRKDRDRTRAKLLKLRKKGVKQGLSNPNFYTRDQFTVGKHYVFVVEHFDLLGDRAIRYSFTVYAGEGGPKSMTISLGSYAATNQIAVEAGSLKPGQRLFHLDRYDGAGHGTLDMYKGEPSYDTVKKTVVARLRKRK